MTENYAKMEPKWEPNWPETQKRPVKCHAEIDAESCFVSKGAKHRKNLYKVRFPAESGPKTIRPVVRF